MADQPDARLPGAVKGLSAVSLFNDFASEMVYPILPAFITGPLGGNAVVLGLIDGAADLVSAAVKWVSGRLADRPGWAKPLILAGYGVATLVRPLISLASAAWQVIGLRMTDRVGKGLRSPARDAMIVSLTPEPVRGRAFGLHRAADHFGAVLGSLAAWALLVAQVDLRSVIGWSVLPGLVAVVVLLMVLRRVKHADVAAPVAPPVQGRPRHDQTGTDFWMPVSVLVVLTVARLPETLLLLRLQDLGVPVVTIPLIWAGLHVVRSGSSYPGGWLADRLGTHGALAAGALLYAVAVVVLAFSISAGWAIAVFLLHGLVAGLIEPAERVAVARLAPVRTGRGFGVFQGVAGAAALPAGLGFGWMYVAMGGPAALLTSAAILVVVAPLWLRIGR